MGDPKRISVGDQAVTAIIYRAEKRAGTLILAHGAGASQRHRFMVAWAEGLAARGLDVVTFDFLYTEKRRGAPDKPALLEGCFRAVAEAAREFTDGPFALGGKSMGGRIASQIVAGGVECAALLFLGYPLHPPKQPEKLRVAHWPLIGVPALFVQGTRDPFGGPDELRAHFGSLRASVIPVEGGDHSFAVPKKLGVAQAELDERLRDEAAAWLKLHMTAGKPSGSR